MSLHLDGVDYLSPSAASTLTDCERKWWWRYQRKLGRDERTEPLAMGGGMAAALEFGDLGRGLAEYHIRRPELDSFTDPVKYEREGWIGDATIRAAYAGYVFRWPDHAANVRREQTYMVDLPGEDTRRLVQVRVDGVTDEYLIEDKLRSASSMRTDAIENELRQGRQLTAEIYVHWRCTGELLPVKLRCVKKIDPRKVKTLETEEQVIEAIGLHFDSDGVFNEWDAVRAQYQLEEFEIEFGDMALRADDLASSPVPTGRRNTGSCHAYGRTCPALAHCQGMLTEAELLGVAS